MVVIMVTRGKAKLFSRFTVPNNKCVNLIKIFAPCLFPMTKFSSAPLTEALDQFLPALHLFIIARVLVLWFKYIFFILKCLN